jgi:hypothetical protein
VSSAHDVCDLMEYARFFGIHEVFLWARGNAIVPFIFYLYM